MNWSFNVSSCIKSLLKKGIICLNLVRIWYIFPTRTFVLNAVKEPGIFFFFFLGGGGGGFALIKTFCTVSQWVNPAVSNRTKSNKNPIELNRTIGVRLGSAIEQNRTCILL